MTFGEDFYGRYIEIEGERFTVEPFPYWNTMHMFYLKPLARFQMFLWWLSKQTGWGWHESA